MCEWGSLPTRGTGLSTWDMSFEVEGERKGSPQSTATLVSRDGAIDKHCGWVSCDVCSHSTIEADISNHLG